ncbi:hypothetical protein [Kitasatospora sp. MBT63]|uniref:hypothetical protein n=1 Tax=Kitasatospora sp. MBT63 TaxID=1444768 RepID=UPI0018F5930B|nr:hypothetical protein [Kitasatospora sp. MBT63]
MHSPTFAVPASTRLDVFTASPPSGQSREVSVRPTDTARMLVAGPCQLLAALSAQRHR